MQELLGSSANLIGGERRIPINGVTLDPTLSQSSSSSSIPTSTTSSTTNTTKSTTTTSTTTPENLRCPRCDSSNTKFCYYNNYNLTQPRHFCKTCRRYWTKGGALRNVPIGGGCRKNKATSLPSSSCSTGTKPSATNNNNKMMKSMACEIGRPGFGLNGFDHIYELPSSPVLWASPHQNNSHILSLLRAGAMQNPNPNPTSLSNSFKEEGGKMGTHMVTEPIVPMAGLSGRAIDLDPLSQVPSLCLSNPTWRNNPQGNGGLVVDDQAQNSGLQQLYHRLRASTDHYSDGSSAILLSNVASSSASTSSNAISEPNPVVGGVDLGFWNPSFSWSDLPTTTNGAYHN